VTLTWSPPQSDGGSGIITYFVISSPDGFSTAVPGDVACSCAIVTGLANGTSYTFTVIAANSIGLGLPSVPTAPATPATVPGAPTGVNAIAGNGSVVVTWLPPRSSGGLPISEYTITPFVGLTPGNAETVGGDATEATVRALTNGVTYTFKVSAQNLLGAGPAGSSNAVRPDP
jgi:hypothetical protein